MQDSGTTPLQSPGVLGALATVHFAILAILAVLVVIGIVYGMKLSRRRRQGVRELEDAGHLSRVGDAPAADPDAPGETVVARADEVGSGDHGAVVQEPVVEAPAPAPVIAAPAPAPAPASAPVAPVVDAPVPVASDLTRLKGLGPKVAAMLVDLGIPDIATLATLDAAQADAVAGHLGTFAPRMARDRWVEQARYLAAGDIAGFEAVFGKL